MRIGAITKADFNASKALRQAGDQAKGVSFLVRFTKSVIRFEYSLIK